MKLGVGPLELVECILDSVSEAGNGEASSWQRGYMFLVRASIGYVVLKDHAVCVSVCQQDTNYGASDRGCWVPF